MKTGIYKIVSPDGHIYIGQSIDIEKRFAQHRRNRDKGYSKLKSSFNYHGAYNHEFEIIEECEFKDLNTREKYWFDYYCNSGCEMLNSKVIYEGIKKEIKKRVKVERNVVPNCSEYSIYSTGFVVRHSRPLKNPFKPFTGEKKLDFKIDKHNNVCVRMKTDDGIHKYFILDDLIAEVFLEKGHTYYKTAPEWEFKKRKQVFNNRVDQFVRSDVYDRMKFKPTIYKTIRL